MVSDQPALDARAPARRIERRRARRQSAGRDERRARQRRGSSARAGISRRCWPASATCRPCGRSRSSGCSRRPNPRGRSPFLADASGVGTTMLIAHGTPAAARTFRARSAAAHHAPGGQARCGRWGPCPTRSATWTPRSSCTRPRPRARTRPPVTLVDHETGRLGRHQVITATDAARSGR